MREAVCNLTAAVMLLKRTLQIEGNYTYDIVFFSILVGTNKADLECISLHFNPKCCKV